MQKTLDDIGADPRITTVDTTGSRDGPVRGLRPKAERELDLR